MNKIKNKKAIIMITIVVLIGVVLGITLAYFQSSASIENEFNTGNYRVVTNEVFSSPTNWKPCETISKTITTTNEGTIDAAVRVKLVGKWYDSNNNDVTASVPSNSVVINYANQNDWTQEGDYYYYNYILEPQDTTSSLISSVQLSCDINGVSCTTSQDGSTKTCESTSPVTGKTYKLTATIDTVQSNKYEDVWNTSNINITTKPSGNENPSNPSTPITPTDNFVSYNYCSYDNEGYFDESGESETFDPTWPVYIAEMNNGVKKVCGKFPNQNVICFNENDFDFEDGGTGGNYYIDDNTDGNNNGGTNTITLKNRFEGIGTTCSIGNDYPNDWDGLVCNWDIPVVNYAYSCWANNYKEFGCTYYPSLEPNEVTGKPISCTCSLSFADGQYGDCHEDWDM